MTRHVKVRLRMYECDHQFLYTQKHLHVSFLLQHIGPAIPEVSSIWFKLYLYHVTGQGPPSLLLSKGSRLRKLPDTFQVSPDW